MAWTPLTLDPNTLGPTRQTAHWASQLVAAVGTTLLPAQDDFSHTNLGWESSLGALTGRTVDEHRTRAGLVLAGATLVIVRGEDDIVARVPLPGRTLASGLGWLRESLDRTLDREVPELQRPEHEMPADPVADGGSFPISNIAALREIGRWISDFHDVLTTLAAGQTGASEVRLWPHHFDLATRVVLDAEADPEDAKSVNLGLSLGDDARPQPYGYIGPWPKPEPGTVELPTLDHGEWDHWPDGFFGATLLGTDIVVDDQADRVETFFAQAFEQAKRILD